MLSPEFPSTCCTAQLLQSLVKDGGASLADILFSLRLPGFIPYVARLPGLHVPGLSDPARCRCHAGPTARRRASCCRPARRCRPRTRCSPASTRAHSAPPPPPPPTAAACSCARAIAPSSFFSAGARRPEAARLRAQGGIQQCRRRTEAAAAAAAASNNQRHGQFTSWRSTPLPAAGEQRDRAKKVRAPTILTCRAPTGVTELCATAAAGAAGRFGE